MLDGRFHVESLLFLGHWLEEITENKTEYKYSIKIKDITQYLALEEYCMSILCIFLWPNKLHASHKWGYTKQLSDTVYLLFVPWEDKIHISKLLQSKCNILFISCSYTRPFSHS